MGEGEFVADEAGAASWEVGDVGTGGGGPVPGVDFPGFGVAA